MAFAIGRFIGNGKTNDQWTADHGTTSALHSWYEVWDGGTPYSFSSTNPNVALTRSMVPILSWQPVTSRDSTTPFAGHCNNSAIAAGTYDNAWYNGGTGNTGLIGFANAVKAWGGRLIIRLAYEMNTNASPWTPGQGGNTAASYVAMWQHIVTVFRNQAANNVQWFWCPLTDGGQGGNVANWTTIYPGDSYVDYVGTDVYMYGSGTWAGFSTTWTDPTSVLMPTYRKITAFTQKPWIIGELGVHETGGSKYDWILDGIIGSWPRAFPLLQGIVWFEDGAVPQDWGTYSTPHATEAVQRMLRTPTGQGTI